MGIFVSVTTRQDIAHLSVMGELDAFTALQLRRPISDALDDGCRFFTVDLEDLTFIDAGGLSALVGLRNATRRVSGSLTFVDVSPSFRRTCRFAGLVEGVRRDGAPQ